MTVNLSIAKNRARLEISDSGLSPTYVNFTQNEWATLAGLQGSQICVPADIGGVGVRRVPTLKLTGRWGVEGSATARLTECAGSGGKQRWSGG